MFLRKATAKQGVDPDGSQLFSRNMVCLWLWRLTSLTLCPIPNCSEPVDSVPISKSDNSIVLNKRFLPVALTFLNLKHTELALFIVRFHLSILLTKTFSLLIKLSGFVWDDFALPFPHSCNSVDKLTRSMQSSLLDYSSALDFVLRFPVLYQLETSGCSRPLLTGLSDYFAIWRLCTRLDWRTRNPLVND